MTFRYVKLHGAGNSYVYVEASDVPAERHWPAVARAVSDPATGLGGDGLIVVGPSPVAVCSMRIFNQDGSEAEFCGNGVRALGKYLYDRGRARGQFSISTRAGSVGLEVLQARAGRAWELAVTVPRPQVVDVAAPFVLETAGKRLALIRVDVGNPHAVLLREGRLPSKKWLRTAGPAVSRHPLFADGVNFHAAAVHDRSRVTVWHFERGSGETRACGSGAIAVYAAGRAADLLGERVRVKTPGGLLSVEDAGRAGLRLIGPAREVSRGWFSTGR